MSRWISLCVALVVLGWTALPCRSPACSLCDAALRSRNTLREELADAKVVLYGSLDNQQFNKKPGAPPGSGTTDFHVLRVVIDDPARGGRSKIEVAKYLPVTDPINPEKFIAFFSVKNGQLDLYHGRFVKSDALLTYLAGILAVRGKDRTQQLEFFFKHLDDEDRAISDDAFLELARLSDVEVANAAKHFPTAKLEAFLLDPKTPPERLGLYAFLLGAAAHNDNAAALLRKMLEHPTERTASAIDGLLTGYINLKPREGWDLAAKILGDAKKPINQRYPVVRALRFYHAWKPVEFNKEIMHCLAVTIDDGEIADIAIDELRQWKTWDLTKQILTQYGKPSHDSPLARRGIVRYALCCPLPEARQFVAAVRQRDPDLVRELEESLEFEKGK